MKSKEEIREYHRKYMKEYVKRDYVKKKMEEYRKTPRAIEIKRNWQREYMRKPEIKIRTKEYLQRPEVRHRRKKYFQSLEQVEKRKLHYENPSVKEMTKEYLKDPRVKKMRSDWEKERRKNNVQYRIKKRLRANLLHAFNVYTDTGKIVSSRNYDIDWSKVLLKLLATLPRDFEPEKYHIDHIKPLVSFDLENPEEIKKAFAPENHQWLLAEDNMKKGCKYPYAVTFDQSVLNVLEITA